MRAVEFRKPLVEGLIKGVHPRNAVHLVLRRIIDRFRELIVRQNCETFRKAALQCKLQRVIRGVTHTLDNRSGAEGGSQRPSLIRCSRRGAWYISGGIQFTS